MSVEGRNGASEHVDATHGVLQPIINEEPTVGGLDVKDASERSALDEKANVDETGDVAGGATTTSGDGVDGRDSLDSVLGVWPFSNLHDIHSLTRPLSAMYRRIRRTQSSSSDFTSLPPRPWRPIRRILSFWIAYMNTQICTAHQRTPLLR
jgi:hypothetical protein